MMQSMRKSIIIIAIVALSSCNIKNNDFETKVREAITYQMKVYPKSTLKDIYKNFFQDRFGPGHLINDTIAAEQYLLYEMNSYTTSSGEMAEPIGWEHNFYRVNLSALKDSLIPCDLLLTAFIRSANGVKPISLEEWRKEWTQIEDIIRTMSLSLLNYEKDHKETNRQLTEGKYVGHHSQEFREAYSPHYRIISKQIFEEELLPLLDNSSEK